jgi:FixJ family two-component response regulator
MPGQSGLELQEALRSRGYQMPVILVTAYPNDKDRTRALNNGAIDFLSKPFDDRWLMECLTDAIKLHDKSGPGWNASQRSH